MSSGCGILKPGLPDMDPCCYGSAVYGPEGCTCWEAVMPDRADPQPSTDLTVRDRRCIDCAYRPDSPERADGTLDAVGLSPVRPFFCHQGLTPIAEYRHPSGAVYRHDELPSSPGIPMDYQPRINAAGWPCKDDGAQQDVCAGWAAEYRRLLRQEP